MQAVLTQINSMPGIVGSLVCDEDGRLTAQANRSLHESGNDDPCDAGVGGGGVYCGGYVVAVGVLEVVSSLGFEVSSGS